MRLLRNRLPRRQLVYKQNLKRNNAKPKRNRHELLQNMRQLRKRLRKRPLERQQRRKRLDWQLRKQLG